MKKMRFKKGSRLLDLCSGPGRHAVVFAQRGLKVTAYDFSGEYLAEARRKAVEAGVKIKTVRGDMRRLKYENEFNAVVNLFTSFGYFEKYSDDLKVLRGINRALKKGGLFLMDTMNADWLMKNFRPRDWQNLESGTWHLEESFLQKGKKRLVNRWIRIKPGGEIAERNFFLRLYDKKDLSSALEKTGFKPLKFWGGFRGSKLSARTKRLIVLAKKT